MSFGDRLRGSTARLVNRLGGEATLRIATSVYNEATLTRVNTYVDHVVPMLVHPRTQGNADGTVMRSEAARVTIPAERLPAGVTPAESSLVVLAGVSYRVLTVEIVAPGGAPIVSYELELAPVAGGERPAA